MMMKNQPLSSLLSLSKQTGLILHQCHSGASLSGVSDNVSNLRRIRDLPGPYSPPGFGLGIKLAFSAKARATLHLLQIDLIHKYGDVIKLRMPKFGYTPAVACPKLIEDIVRHQDPVPERGSVLSWETYLESENKSKALLTSHGKEWERRRKSVRGLMLKVDAMKSAYTYTNSVSNDLCGVIECTKDSYGYVPNIDQAIHHWSFEGIVKILFGTRAGCLGSKTNKHGDEFVAALNVLLAATLNSLTFSAPLQRSLNTRLWRQHKEAWDIVSDSVEYHNAEMMDSLENINPDSTPLMISLMSNNHLSNDDIHSMAMEMLFGSVDTTSNTMSFLLYNLASNPEKLEKLQQEIQSVIGEEEPTLDHVLRMTYLRNCLKESLRMYPALFLNSRTLHSDFWSERHNVYFPAGTSVMFHNYALGRRDSLWENPDDFMPERFDRAPGAPQGDQTQFFSVPFGFGTRSCIGKRVAEAEISSLIIKILKTYDMSIDDRYPFIPVTRGVLTPGKHLPIRFHKRRC